MQPGWYPDPTGRYELRYFNGTVWTADVSRAGERLVDAMGTAPTPVPVFVPPPVEPTNGLATAAMVTGLTGLGLGIVFLFPLSFPLGILAVVFGGIGLKRSARVGLGRPQAITGLVAGPIAIILSVVALVTLWDDIVDALHDAQVTGAVATAYSIALDPAKVDGRRVICSGTLTNERPRERDFVVRIDFLPNGNSKPFATDQTTVVVAATGSADFFVTATQSSGADGARCAVDSVRTTD